MDVHQEKLKEKEAIESLEHIARTGLEMLQTMADYAKAYLWVDLIGIAYDYDLKNGGDNDTILVSR